MDHDDDAARAPQALRGRGRLAAPAPALPRARVELRAIAGRESREDAEDVAQETLLAFAQAFREGRYDRERSRLGHWLFGIAFRQACRQRRRDARPEQPVAGGPDTAEDFWRELPDETAAQAAWDEEWSRHVLAEVTRLVRTETSPATYGAFALTVLDEKSPAEAAVELGLDVKTVYDAKHGVLKRMRELREEMESLKLSA
jgi:RNA polymerase sigma factor (sigma-70 family)